MANETFISKNLEQYLQNKELTLKEKLTKTANLLQQDWNMKINFCKLFKKRWSFFAGTDELIIPEKKIIINQDYGIIVENNTLTDQQWEEVIQLLRGVLI